MYRIRVCIYSTLSTVSMYSTAVSSAEDFTTGGVQDLSVHSSGIVSWHRLCRQENQVRTAPREIEAHTSALQLLLALLLWSPVSQNLPCLIPFPLPVRPAPASSIAPHVLLFTAFSSRTGIDRTPAKRSSVLYTHTTVRTHTREHNALA